MTHAPFHTIQVDHRRKALLKPGMTEGPLYAYREKLEKGELKPDSAQALAAEKLQSLHHALKDYQPDTGHSGWIARFGLGRRSNEDKPQGLYIYGPVGRGKSMLMDLFFKTAPVKRKKRVHFHTFMQDIHERLEKARKKEGVDNPIPPVAKDVAEETWLLCFDEFQVDNIVDAMILKSLFEALLEAGVVVVATSNTPPGDLYKGGLQRERFLPFIDLIRKEWDVLELASPRDYRLMRLRTMQVYLTPHNGKNQEKLLDDFEELAGCRDAGPDYLLVKGRRVNIPMAANGVAYATFEDLCAKPLGAGDYLEIARQYHTLILSHIPKLEAKHRNEARRFVNLIDALYEHKVNLICSADAEPQKIYPEGEGTFEFQRTVSRLMEMQSDDYLSLPHLS